MLGRVTQLRDIMTEDVLTVAPEDTLGEVATRMVERNVGSVVVFDFGRLIGVLTERDIMRAVAARTHSSDARVREWMTADPITASADTSVEDAARTMFDNGFRHLPIVEGDRAVGIVSIRDVAEWGIAHAVSSRPNRAERKLARDHAVAATPVHDVDGVVLPVRAGDSEEEREPAPEAQPALLGQRPLEHEGVSFDLVIRSLVLRNAV